MDNMNKLTVIIIILTFFQSREVIAKELGGRPDSRGDNAEANEVPQVRNTEADGQSGEVVLSMDLWSGQKIQSSFTDRQIDLKIIKGLLIVFLSIDLIITCLVHYHQNDQSVWYASFKIRLSKLSLISSNIYFLVVVGGIIFDIYYILLAKFIINILAIFTFIILSSVHICRKVDFSAMDTKSAVFLLMAILLYLLFMISAAGMTIYIMKNIT